MTEKRYYIGNGKNCTICDKKKGGSDFFNMLTQFQATDRLNELNDMNQRLQKENKELKSLCKVLIKHIEKNSIAFVIDEDIRRLLE